MNVARGVLVMLQCDNRKLSPADEKRFASAIQVTTEHYQLLPQSQDVRKRTTAPSVSTTTSGGQRSKVGSLKRVQIVSVDNLGDMQVIRDNARPFIEEISFQIFSWLK